MVQVTDAIINKFPKNSNIKKNTQRYWYDFRRIFESSSKTQQLRASLHYIRLTMGVEARKCGRKLWTSTAIARLLPYSTDVLMLPAMDTEGGVIN